MIEEWVKKRGKEDAIIRKKRWGWKSTVGLVCILVLVVVIITVGVTQTQT